jgi:hypothetical protein
MGFRAQNSRRRPVRPASVRIFNLAMYTTAMPGYA